MGSEQAEQKKRRWKPTHGQMSAAVLIVIATAGIFASWGAYRSQVVHKHPQDFSASTGAIAFNNKDQPTVAVVTINAYLLSVTPETKTAEFRLVFGYWEPNTTFASPYLPSQVGVSVSVLGTATDPTENSVTTANSYRFDQGQQMRAIDVKMNLASSTTQTYPFDRYIGFLIFKVTDGQGNIVPISVNFTNTADGWFHSLDSNLCDVIQSDWYPFGSLGPGTGAGPSTGAGPNSAACQVSADTSTTTAGFQGLQITLFRTPISRLYAVFIMGLMCALALAGVIMAMTLIRSTNHKIEAGPLTYLAALLFAFPLMRTLLPGSPALGVVADFAAYFWVEAVVGLTLLALLLTWISRERRELKKEAEQGAPDPEARVGAEFEDS